MSSTSIAFRPSLRRSLATWLGTRLRARLALVAGAATILAGSIGLLLTHHPTRLVVPERTALHYALTEQPAAAMLASVHWKRVQVTSVDNGHEVLGFYRGPRVVATVTVGFHRHVVILDATNLTREKYEYGSVIANDTRVLAVLCIVFVLMSAVWPLRRLRNLDVLVMASLTLSVAFYNRGLLSRMELVTYPAMAYLAGRCSWWALRSPRPSPASTPLYDRLARGWTEVQRVRMLRFAALAAAIAVTAVGLSSLNVIDVGYAAMEGATSILHGVLPYGHLPDVLHGDTYPIGSYLLYVPFAWLSPVHSVWDNADITLAVAVVAALCVAAGLWRTTGRRAAIAWLTFPPLLVTVTTGTTDVALAAILVVAVLLWRRPGWGLTAASGAAWFKLVPLPVMPLLLARHRGRALARALAAAALTSTLMVAVLVALGGLGAPIRMVSAMSFQFTRGSQRSLWTLIGSMPVQQLAQAATIALVVAAVVRIRQDRALAEDRARIAALVGAVLLGLQISANYWNYAYLVWAFPFLALSLLADDRSTVPPAEEVSRSARMA
jgi:hypothetical protein